MEPIGEADIVDGSQYGKIIEFSGPEITQGIHTLSYYAVDKLGNQSGTHSPLITNLDAFKHKEITITASKERAKPKIGIVLDNNGSIPSDPFKFKHGELARINFRVSTDPDGFAREIRLYQGVEPLQASNGLFHVEYDSSDPLHRAGFFPFEFNASTEGTHEFRAMVLDSFGAQRFQDIPFQVDIVKRASIAPTVNLKKWDDNSTFFSITSTSEVMFSATALDEDGSIDNVQFYVNGLPYGDSISYDSTQTLENYPYSIEWSPEKDFIAGVEDNFVVYAKATDTSGNEVMSEQVMYQVTRGGANIPELSMESLSSSYEINKTIFLSVEQISDLNENNDTGMINEVSFVVNGTIVDTSFTLPYFTAFTPLEEGVFEVYAMARDSEGNYGISEKQVFVINNNMILLDTPSLGSINPNLSGELLSFSRERRMGRRSQGASEPMDYTVIEGFNTAFLNQLTKDQRIRFAVGDQITEETYKVSEIRTDNVLVMEGNFTANDQTLISRGAEIQVIQSYRVGSFQCFEG